MTKAIKVLVILLCAIFVFSCKRGLNSVAYIQYIQDKENGLKKTVSVGEWEYLVQYKPHDYIILLENRGNVKSFDIKKRKADLKGTAWFNISFRVSDGRVSPMRYNLASREEYDTRLNYFLSRAQSNIRLIYNKRDTLFPVGYLFENNYNLAPQETIVVGFELPEKGDQTVKDMLLCYHDEIFKNGIIKVAYRGDDVQRIPNLIYN